MNRYRGYFILPAGGDQHVTVETSASNARVAAGRLVDKFDREATRNNTPHADKIVKEGTLTLVITRIED